jgi:hypothetical protein
MLDDVTGDILTFVDTDDDAVPDSLGAAFADSAEFPALAGATSVRYYAEEGVVFASPADLGSDMIGLGTRLLELRDTDADGEADASDEYDVRDHMRIGPTFGTYPEPGLTVITVVGNAGNAIELWETDQNGEEIALLGTETVPAAENEVDFDLGDPLEEGTFLALRDVDAETISAVFEVVELEDVP